MLLVAASELGLHCLHNIPKRISGLKRSKSRPFFWKGFVRQKSKQEIRKVVPLFKKLTNLPVRHQCSACHRTSLKQLLSTIIHETVGTNSISYNAENHTRYSIRLSSNGHDCIKICFVYIKMPPDRRTDRQGQMFMLPDFRHVSPRSPASHKSSH